jgi:flagellar biosynthesis/type III secretory pathway protein FliH
VSSYALPELSVKGKGDYRAVKARYGALAQTDEDRPHKGTRDNRFAVNPLLRDPLAIETEERRVIDARVREQFEQVRAKAQAEGEKAGFEAGLKKGCDQAYEEFREKAAESLKSFESLVQSFESLKGEIFKANEHFLMALVFRVAKMVTLKELSTDQDYVLRLSRQLLDQVGIRDNVKIRVSPKDADSIEFLKAELAKHFVDLKNLGIEVSDTVEGGGCTIETQWSTIDASLETQLEGFRQALLEGGSPAPKSE